MQITTLIKYTLAGLFVAAYVAGACATLAVYRNNHEAERNALNGRQIPTAELQVQQEVAEWTLGALLVSVAGALVAGAGVLYVAMTLQEQRRAAQLALEAAGLAQRQADLAQVANQQAQEFFLLERRPWVLVRAVIVARSNDVVTADRKSVV